MKALKNQIYLQILLYAALLTIPMVLLLSLLAQTLEAPEIGTQEKRLRPSATGRFSTEITDHEYLVHNGGAGRPLKSSLATQTIKKQFQNLIFFGGLANFFVLFVFLSAFFNKTISNEKILKNIRSEKFELFEKIAHLQNKLSNVEKFSVMRYMATGFAHEVGTPLNAVGMHLELLKNDLEKTSTVFQTGKPPLKRIEIVSTQLKRIQKIVRNFLKHSSRPSLQMELINLNTLIEETLEVVMPRVVALEVKVDLNFDKTLPLVRGIPLEIEQVMLNLFGNALDAIKTMKEDAPKRSLEIAVKTFLEENQNNLWAVIEIEDNGAGIDTDNMEQVFDPFFTTKPPGQGTGVGLSVCKDLLEKHRGSIRIFSKKGYGSKMVLRLPVEESL